MSTSWPGGFDPETQFVPSDPTDPVGSSTPTLVQVSQNLSDSVRALQLEIGPSPSGAYADIASKLYAIEGSAKGTEINTGLVVSPGTGLSVSTTAGSGTILDMPHTQAASTNKALTADPTNPRYVLLYWNILYGYVAQLGTPAPRPVAPTPNYETSLPLALIYLPAGATAVSSGDIYPCALRATRSRVLGGVWNLVDFDITRNRTSASTDWEDVYNWATYYISEVAGGGTLQLPGFTTIVSGRVFAPSGVHFRGANQATSRIRLNDHTDLGMSATRHRCMIESVRPASALGIIANEWHTDNWNTDNDTGVFGSTFEHLSVDGNQDNQDVDYVDGTGNYEGGGGIGLYGMALILDHVYIYDCVGWGLMTNSGHSALGPTNLDGTGSGIDGGIPLESRFANLVLDANMAGNWWFRGPHDGIAYSIVSVNFNNQRAGDYCDYGIYAEGGPLQITQVHQWGGRCRVGVMFKNASPGRIMDIVAEGAHEAQIMIHATGGGQFNALETFTQGNYNQRSLAMAWQNGSMITAHVNGGPGGGLCAHPGNASYGRIRVSGTTGTTITSLAVTGIASGANLLNGSVAWATSDQETARAIRDSINAKDDGVGDTISYCGRDLNDNVWVYFGASGTPSVANGNSTNANDNNAAGNGQIIISQTGGTAFYNDMWWNGSPRGWRDDFLAWGFPLTGAGPGNFYDVNVKGMAQQRLDLVADITNVATTFQINAGTDASGDVTYPPEELDAAALILASSSWTMSTGQTGVYPFVIQATSGERMRVTDYVDLLNGNFQVTVTRGYEGTTAVSLTAGANKFTRVSQPTTTTLDANNQGRINWSKPYTDSIERLSAPHNTFRGYSKFGAGTSKLAFGGITNGGTVPPTISGSRGANAALASLIDGLEAMGLVVDSTSA